MTPTPNTRLQSISSMQKRCVLDIIKHTENLQNFILIVPKYFFLLCSKIQSTFRLTFKFSVYQNILNYREKQTANFHFVLIFY